MSQFIINYYDGNCKSVSAITENGKYKKHILTEALDYEKISSVDIPIGSERMFAGDDGYYLIPGGWGKCAIKETALGYFRKREDAQYVNVDSYTPYLAVCHGGKAVLYLVTGMSMDVCQVVRIKDGEYSFYLRITTDGDIPYENIEVTEIPADGDLSYSALARALRKYKLEECGFIPLKEKMTPELRYTAGSLCVRIRHAWKPVPCKILDQTPENEPPLHVACTFADVEKIMQKYHEAGIDKAEFCLVGWNIKGHDGRWPQIFPVESALGGEEGLKKLFCTAKKLGYSVVCHTNSTDAYSVADNFDKNFLALKKDGSISVEAEYWAGGRTYNICPKYAYELTKNALDKIAETGFHGTHYIDVATCTAPRKCYHPDHPVNKAEARDYFDAIFKYAKERIGGASSEGAYDHYLKNVDFILYSSFYKEENTHFLADKFIPFWEIVYHGIILSNPYASTVNSCINKDPKFALKLIECGGRPSLYYYSHFVSDGTDWMGDDDLTVENLDAGVEKIKKQYDTFSELSYLQYEYIESHKEVSDNVFETEYSDGTVVTVNYNTLSHSVSHK